MKKILSASQTIQALCGEEKIEQGRDYCQSMYTMTVPCGAGTLLYHTLTGVLYLLAPNETIDANREELIRNRILVPSGVDEYRHARDIWEILKLLSPQKKNKTAFTIFTTTDCNARCFYCYERGIRRISMTKETAEDVAAYIARVSGGNDVDISWFGGEPLLNKTVIDIICSELRRLGVAYRSIMTSNGYYLDAETARKAVAIWKVKRVQITIDGTREVYNRVKAYAREDIDGFERVLNNIKYAMTVGLNVTIRLNYDASNYENVLMLVDELHDRLGNPKGLRYMPVLLQEWGGPIQRFNSEDETIIRMKTLRNKLLSLGMLAPEKLDREIHIARCMADNDASETILPDGRIGKCEHDAEKNIVGSIYDDTRDELIINEWKETVEYDECRTCILSSRCVQLKKCSWVSNGCSSVMRRYRIEKLQNAILNHYECVKEKTKDSERYN